MSPSPLSINTAHACTHDRTRTIARAIAYAADRVFVCGLSFLPFELWTHNSQALSFGAYHCPVGMFVDTSGASLLDHEHISRFV